MNLENTEHDPQENTENTEDVNIRDDDNQEQATDNDSMEAVADLSKFSRFKLGEEELTPDQLRKERMLHSDYTKKTQEIAQERRYVSNLQADLEKISRNPALAEEFRRVYPRQFHNYLNFVLRETNASQQTNRSMVPNSQANILDPRVEKALSTIERLEKEREEDLVNQRVTEIDSAFSKFSSKYPLATPNGYEGLVLSKAQRVIESGDKMDDSKWEKIFKESEQHFSKAYESHYKTRINNQKAAHIKGKDIGSGGGVPGGAPQMPRTIKEAARIAEEELTRRP